MTERGKVLLQREGVRQWMRRGSPMIPYSIEVAICAAFPLPPERVPNVVREGRFEYRCWAGEVQTRWAGERDVDDGWESFEPGATEAIRTVLACPWVERPAEEE